VLLLGMEASEDELERGFALAARHPVCKGFAVGRSIFMDAARLWFAYKLSDREVISRVEKNYASLVAAWRKARQACKESVS
jgi:5-dehydro-2-deoxygluconokinase